MAAPASSIRISGLSRKLIHDGLLSEQDAVNAQEEAQNSGITLASHLVKNNLVQASDLAYSASGEFGIPLLDIDSIDLESLPKDIVPEKLIRQHHAFPIQKRSNRLFVAISDPMNLAALDAFKFSSGITTEAVLVEEDKLVSFIDQALRTDNKALKLDDLMDDHLENLEVVDEEDEQAEIDANADDTPIISFVNKCLLDAIIKKASDIHFEPYEKAYRIRFRIDGMLEEISTPPQSLAPRISARLKVMARLDISERRIPQDGRIKIQLSNRRSIDFRVNTLPTLFGEKIVVRILDQANTSFNIDMLGYEENQKQLYLHALSKPQGLILVTGPTGSGKTVSLYAGLNILNTTNRNISTAEDPAEINMPGVNQVNVNSKVGLTFASALRAFLRQDPDVIMVGEIRDLETAEIAIKAAQTGHLVLSTLHTNEASQTLTRLASMGLPPYNIASSVSLIIAQRLGRRLCEQCKVIDEVPSGVLLGEGFVDSELSDLKIYKAVGCSQCNDIGYKSRVGIFQVLEISEEMGNLIMENGNSFQIAEQARKEGIKDLRASGLDKVREGVLSLEEFNRVIKD